MKKSLFILSISLLTIGCSDSNHFGYERLENTIHYRLLALGDEDLPVKNADHISLKVTLETSDSLNVQKDFRRINWKKSRFPDYLMKLLNEANHGDSLSIIGASQELKINAVFQDSIISEGQEDVEVKLFVYEAYTDQQLRKVMAAERLKADLELTEKADLNRVLDSLDMSEEDIVDGVYVKLLDTSNGRPPMKGDYITVNYSTRLANNRVVDDNFKLEPLSYVVGKPDQVIPGFAIGMSVVPEGSKAVFVIPSELGFGAKGSSGGIVPGHAILVYNVHFVKIED